MSAFLDQFFKRFNMVSESLFSCFGREIAGIGFFTDKLFFDGDVIFSFKRLGVARQIAIGYSEQFLECIEIGRIVDHQYAHNAEPYPVVKCLVDILDDVFQGYKFSGFGRI